MKRLLALVLAAMMLASVTCAWAEGKTEALPEITFRGVPFGANWAEFRNTLDVMKDVYPQGFGPGYAYISYRIDDIVLNGYAGFNEDPLAVDTIFYGNGFDSYFRMTKTLVAGYELYSAAPFFVRPVVEGAIVTDDDAAIFYAAYYEFTNCDDDMEADLNAKLTSLYGTPESITDEQGNNRIIWHGANDTEVILCRCNFGHNIRITYAWLGAEALIDEALAVAAANLPPAEDISGNTSGL